MSSISSFYRPNKFGTRVETTFRSFIIISYFIDLTAIVAVLCHRKFRVLGNIACLFNMG
jgi:hypothetical protein